MVAVFYLFGSKTLDMVTSSGSHAICCNNNNNYELWVTRSRDKCFGGNRFKMAVDCSLQNCWVHLSKHWVNAWFNWIQSSWKCISSLILHNSLHGTLFKYLNKVWSSRCSPWLSSRQSQFKALCFTSQGPDLNRSRWLLQASPLHLHPDNLSWYLQSANNIQLQISAQGPIVRDVWRG